MNTSQIRKLVMLAAVGLLAEACTLTDTKAPPLSGPSELAVSLAVTATPDLIAANGSSQSVINIVSRDAYGQPLPFLPLRVDTVNASGLIVEQGTLSDRDTQTDGNGKKVVTFTAPGEYKIGVDANGEVTVRVLPILKDYGTGVARYVTIRLVPPTVIAVPGAPFARFRFSPADPKVNDVISFDASDSSDSDGIASYAWDWDDGQVGRSVVKEEHDFRAAGTYYVKLTVTDKVGQQGSLTQPITVK